MDGVLPSEEYIEEELAPFMHKPLKEKYKNPPEVLSVYIELKRVQEELEHYRNLYDLGKREVLEEIQDLRNQLQCYMDSSSSSSLKRESHSMVPLSSIPETTSVESSEVKFELDRRKWISLTNELRTELDAARALVEKQKQEHQINVTSLL